LTYHSSSCNGNIVLVVMTLAQLMSTSFLLRKNVWCPTIRWRKATGVKFSGMVIPGQAWGSFWLTYQSNSGIERSQNSGWRVVYQLLGSTLTGNSPSLCSFCHWPLAMEKKLGYSWQDLQVEMRRTGYYYVPWRQASWGSY
jgi:hypothetical protein